MTTTEKTRTENRGHPAPQMPVIPIERMALSIEEFVACTGISRATVYRRFDDGSLKAIKFGKRRLIPMAAVREIMGA